MIFTGFFKSASIDLEGNLLATFQIKEKPEAIQFLNNLDKEKLLSLDFKIWRKKRSLDANALLWACIGQMAAALGADKWDIYLKMLQRYGTFTYIQIKPNALAKMKEIWRECEEVGTMPNGDIQLLCYYGSSTYDTKEFTVLLDGVTSEMKEMGLTPPPSKEMERSLREWEQRKK